MKIFAIASAGLLISSISSSVQAQVAYTNSALKGCYAHLSTSVDSSSAAENRQVVGTLCFDGKGNIVAAAHAPFLSGAISNSNGTVHDADDQTGTYSVTNAPGDGMGVFEGSKHCAKHAFVLRGIDSNGLAHGFQYILIKRKETKQCHSTGPAVIGGGAEYQGPLK
jgi:hypothetical protein